MLQRWPYCMGKKGIQRVGNNRRRRGSVVSGVRGKRGGGR